MACDAAPEVLSLIKLQCSNTLSLVDFWPVSCLARLLALEETHFQTVKTIWEDSLIVSVQPVVADPKVA